jgi:hypothetical protein
VAAEKILKRGGCSGEEEIRRRGLRIQLRQLEIRPGVALSSPHPQRRQQQQGAATAVGTGEGAAVGAGEGAAATGAGASGEGVRTAGERPRWWLPLSVPDGPKWRLLTMFFREWRDWR